MLHAKGLGGVFCRRAVINNASAACCLDGERVGEWGKGCHNAGVPCDVADGVAVVPYGRSHVRSVHGQPAQSVAGIRRYADGGCRPFLYGEVAGGPRDARPVVCQRSTLLSLNRECVVAGGYPSEGYLHGRVLGDVVNGVVSGSHSRSHFRPVHRQAFQLIPGIRCDGQRCR